MSFLSNPDDTRDQNWDLFPTQSHNFVAHYVGVVTAVLLQGSSNSITSASEAVNFPYALLYNAHTVTFVSPLKSIVMLTPIIDNALPNSPEARVIGSTFQSRLHYE